MTPTTNQRLVIVLLILLIGLVALCVIGITAVFLVSGGMMGNGRRIMGSNPPPYAGGSGSTPVVRGNGELIFRTGIDADGVAISNSMMPGMGGCAMCHGTDGHGSQMMGQIVPCNTFKCLSADGYTEDLIKRAITQGVAEDGHQLNPMMPRWQMSESDLNDLISYVKSLR